jgi:hypothetical protein
MAEKFSEFAPKPRETERQAEIRKQLRELMEKRDEFVKLINQDTNGKIKAAAEGILHGDTKSQLEDLRNYLTATAALFDDIYARLEKVCNFTKVGDDCFQEILMLSRKFSNYINSLSIDVSPLNEVAEKIKNGKELTYEQFWDLVKKEKRAVVRAAMVACNKIVTFSLLLENIEKNIRSKDRINIFEEGIA